MYHVINIPTRARTDSEERKAMVKLIKEVLKEEGYKLSPMNINIIYNKLSLLIRDTIDKEDVRDLVRDHSMYLELKKLKISTKKVNKKKKKSPINEFRNMANINAHVRNLMEKQANEENMKRRAEHILKESEDNERKKREMAIVRHVLHEEPKIIEIKPKKTSSKKPAAKKPAAKKPATKKPAAKKTSKK